MYVPVESIKRQQSFPTNFFLQYARLIICWTVVIQKCARITIYYGFPQITWSENYTFWSVSPSGSLPWSQMK